MIRNLVILSLAALVISLPFVFRQAEEASSWRPGDPVVVIITPMNEAIRYEFARGFSEWHRRNFGRPAKVDWRALGGTSEIMRFLVSEYVAVARAWWTGKGKPWPAGASEAVAARKLDTHSAPGLREIHETFRKTDDPKEFTVKIDLLWGGGEYDHSEARRQGLIVAPWPSDKTPAGLFMAADGSILIPETMSGETWRTPMMFGNVLSTFGICYNLDRLRDLKVRRPPAQWDDLADPVYFRQIGVCDPTKSGSIAKAFEMIVQQKCRQAVGAAGFREADIEQFESVLQTAKLPPGELPEGVPEEYQAAIERGWENGIRLIQRIGANARYFTDAASKVTIDVSMGDAAAGLAIDFYGRYQAQCSRALDGKERMIYVTPVGGSSVGCDPIGLLRGAEHREAAVRFIQFVLSEEGQRLWTYRPGAPGGPKKYALRRLPIRRDFYPPFTNRLQFATDNLADPTVNPYSLATNFTYRSRWTAQHFNIQRDLIRAMCLDSADELRAAWEAIILHGGPVKQTEAVKIFGRLPNKPEPLTWQSALTLSKKYDRMDILRAWTRFYRDNYARVKETVQR
jgi:iron(III) transport system substrate-binding protein